MGKVRRGKLLIDDNASNKKKSSSKHCDLCEKHGGAKNTLNTVDCKRYEKDGVPKKACKSKKGNSSVKQFHRQSFKTMEETLKRTMKTEFKKMKKGAHKSKKRKLDDSSESDSS